MHVLIVSVFTGIFFATMVSLMRPWGASANMAWELVSQTVQSVGGFMVGAHGALAVFWFFSKREKECIPLLVTAALVFGAVCGLAVFYLFFVLLSLFALGPLLFMPVWQSSLLLNVVRLAFVCGCAVYAGSFAFKKKATSPQGNRSRLTVVVLGCLVTAVPLAIVWVLT